MAKQNYTVTLKFRGYFAGKRDDGRYDLRGRGQRSIVTLDELQVLLNARPKGRR
ncbi:MULTISPECIES: hypothetical protein [Cupriavidus]|uniref:hypothetical protein n=1 Tax=Cupriavidus TaxID=106589 RepID=UPI000A5CCD46|nr:MULTISPECIES: hypothetical protein [Cupriavidus]